MNYESAMRKLRTARNIDRGKPIDRNTRLMLRGENVAVKLHATDVVTFAPDGSVTLNTGGWKTVTTKDRINNASPYQVWSKRGTWYVTIGGISVPFAEGITISASGEVRGGGDQDAERREQSVRKQAKTYAAGFVSALYSGAVKLPSAGDCMLCRGKSDGEHIASHMEENYYVPSLLVNALQAFGASQAATQSAWSYMQKARPVESLEDALAYQQTSAWSKDRNDFIAKQIEKCIRRYALRQLGLAT